ncbi:MAG: diphthamide biosynthesis enzyme Dph2 [Candidatus Methanomethyliaceae archaeon]|nr:diphthamide biosynthesis enzyme Dph2 [Candidatus Methanomethyliaceae archaeon]
MYDLELERIAKEVRSRRARRVLVQAPDGLKQYLKDLYERLSKGGATVFLSADPCYGACDLAEEEAISMKADLLIHVGHFKFSSTKEKIPTIYVPARHFFEMNAILTKTADFLKSKGIERAGLVAGAQHQGYLQEFKRRLSKAGIEAVVDKATGGLILGCRYAAAKNVENAVDAIVYLGGGDFHALGVALSLEKEVYIADPYRDEVRDVERLKKKILAKRWWSIAEAAKVKTFGIILVTKSGQFNKDSAMRIKNRLEEYDKEVVLITADDVNWERMAAFPFVEAFVVTGCPRIALDNQEGFGRPVLNEEDAYNLIGRERVDQLKE